MAEFVDQIPQQPGLAFEEKTHQYILNGTQVLPSVTTLMKPLSDTLYAGIRPETLQAAAERGTEVHSAIEDYVTLGITDISEARRGYFEAFLRWMKDYNVQPLSVEHRAYHPALGYAGTLDMLCTLSKGDTDPQVLTLVDFKTSATVNKMLTGVQLEAYEQMLAATGLQVEQKAIVHLQADGRYQMPVYRKNDAESWRVFMACLTIHMRDNFDAILKKALGNIVKGKSGQADINLKLTISATGENEGQLKPKFKHQVSSVMAIKERESGMVNPNAEMVYDEEEGEYVLRPVKSAQTTLFDTEEKDNEQPGGPERAPSAPVAMLGDGSEESKQGHENDAYNVKFGPFDADDYDIQARKAIVDLLQGYGAKYEITDGGRFVECTISAMHIEDIKEQAESWVCGVERVPSEEKAAPAGKDDDAVDAEFHEVEENSENCAADNNPGEEAEDSDEAPEE